MKHLILLLVVLSWTNYSHSAPCTKQDNIMTLAFVGYMEARGEGETGMRATMEVVLVRLYEDKFPDSICAVVFQPSNHPLDNPEGCAFSFTCEEKDEAIVAYDTEKFNLAVVVAKELLDGGMEYSITNFADHYIRCDHLQHVRWDDNMIRTVRIKNHCYFKDE